MQAALAQFLDYLTTEKARSQNTIVAYRNDLQQFLGFVQPLAADDESAWSTLSPGLIQGYLAHLERQAYAASTVARKMAAVKSLLGYWHAQGYIQGQPADEVKIPKVEKNLPRPLSPDAVERLLTAPTRQTTPRALRDKALLEILYATGMRVSEVVGLDLSDVSLAENIVLCKASDGQRVIPIQPATACALVGYLNQARPHLVNGCEEIAFFLNHRGKRLTRQGLWLIIRDYVEMVGIETPVTPHTLRHSFAIHQLNAGVNLREVQQRLGHASPTTTQRYQRLSEEQSSELVIDGVALLN